MRIACCMTTIGYSGAPKMIAWIANQLLKYGNEVDMVTFFKNDDIQYMEPQIRRFSFDVERKSKTKWGKVGEQLKALKRMKKYIKSEQPDAVLLFSNPVSFLYLLDIGKRSIPTIISERGDPKSGSIVSKVLRKSYIFADGVVCQTVGAKEALPLGIQEKCIVIPNPVTYEYGKRLSANERSNKIAFVARFDNVQKRQDVMVEAFAKVHEKHPDITLTFYGDGPDMEMIMKLVEKMRLTEFVEFAGRVTPIDKYIRDARMLVLTSDFEGIPNSLIDAMSLGLPVVSTDCSPGGARMLIQNGKNGILTDKGSADGVAEGICYILEHPDEADKMGTEAQKILEQYSPVLIGRAWADYFSTKVRNQC